MRFKKTLYLILFLIAIHLLAYNFVATYKLWCLKKYYSFTDKTEAVREHKDLELLLGNLEIIKYLELNTVYLQQTESDLSPFRNMLKSSKYFVLTREQLFQKIVGNHRIIEFIPKDDYLDNCILHSDTLFWLMDPKVLGKFIDLENWLLEQDLDIAEISINNGYRYPKYNRDIGGASQSRHIKGEAIDLKIGDLDKNGRIEKIDKDIIIDILDKEIIKNEGGLGLYPGTQVVHMDTRGFRARWDSY